ncbi:MAG: helix-turn-helix domain-containing protein [Bacteroidetes bacterium]|nr:helix-turn-helix domain-containing protein [Bacteroidota bacterium]
MRKTIKIPRILKINWVENHSVNVTFNNGESRIIDFYKVLKSIGVNEKSTANILNDDNELKKVTLRNNTLSFDNVEQFITLRNGQKEKVPFEIGADILLKHSHPEKSEFIMQLGKMIREARISAGLSQQDLAIMSGTSRTYISRIENDKSDVELGTLKKIIEVGLGKELEVRIK